MSAINPQERIENPDLLPSNNYNNKNNNVCSNVACQGYTDTVFDTTFFFKQQIGEDPLTPCPSAAEYVTPVYAKNYQGITFEICQKVSFSAMHEVL